MEVYENFVDISEKEIMEINGGGWNEFGKALTGTLLVAGGVIICAVPGGATAGIGVVALGAGGIASCAKKK